MKSLAAALIAAQGDMPAVEKNATNPHFGSRFVSLDHLIARTKPVLTKHGLAIVQFPATTDQGAPALTTTLIHGESGEQLSGTVPLVLAKQDMQGLGAALTYARRYGWASALAISDEDDDDGNAASAPGTGATQDSGSAGGQQKVAAARTDGNQGGAAATNYASAGSLAWKYGPHAGVAIADTPLDYVIEYAETGTNGFMAGKCKAFLEESGSAVSDDSEGIPFMATIDGLGN